MLVRAVENNRLLIAALTGAPVDDEEMAWIHEALREEPASPTGDIIRYRTQFVLQ